MAGIEKICEFSGVHYGWKMYDFKRNHIQIHPRYRKHFRGASHTLFINNVEPYFKSKFGGLMGFDPRVKEYFDPPFESDLEYIDYMRQVCGQRLVKQIEFTLRIDDPALAGNVNGDYLETTTDFSALKRRLKRMLRTRKLNIVDLCDPTITEPARLAAKGIAADLDPRNNDDRQRCKQAADSYFNSLINQIQNQVEHGDDETSCQMIKDQEIHWAAVTNTLNETFRIFISDHEFRKVIRKRFPQQARLMGWM